MCLKNTNRNCIEWEFGQFKQIPKKHNQLSIPCLDYSLGYFFQGKWTLPNCFIPWLSSSEMRYSLTNTIYTINFIGDSLTRQIYKRLVFHMRGYTSFAERFYHKNSFYIFNATHDFFYIGETYETYIILNKKDNNKQNNNNNNNNNNSKLQFKSQQLKNNPNHLSVSNNNFIDNPVCIINFYWSYHGGIELSYDK
jgi:hypothetical protein